ncbi:MAG: hypothetical protein U0167_06795 [bacterium]
MSISPEMLRHALATLAYRAAKSLRGAPEGFADYRPTPGKRSPVEILAHMGDLMDWGLSITRGKPAWNEAKPKPWDQEIARFFAAVTAWDRVLAGLATMEAPADRIFQGPIADAFTHVGQISLLRRLAGSPVRGESYNLAPIEIGQTQFEQPPPREGAEFD